LTYSKQDYINIYTMVPWVDCKGESICFDILLKRTAYDCKGLFREAGR